MPSPVLVERLCVALGHQRQRIGQARPPPPSDSCCPGIASGQAPPWPQSQPPALGVGKPARPIHACEQRKQSWPAAAPPGWSSSGGSWSRSGRRSQACAPSPRHSRSGGYTSETDEHRRSQGARKRPGSIQSGQWASSNPLTGISSCIGPPRPQPGRPGSRASLEGGDRGEIVGCGIYNEAATNQWRRMG
jgi:hypothetical protein